MSAWYIDMWVKAPVAGDVADRPEPFDPLHTEMVVNLERGGGVEPTDATSTRARSTRRPVATSSRSTTSGASSAASANRSPS